MQPARQNSTAPFLVRASRSMESPAQRAGGFALGPGMSVNYDITVGRHSSLVHL
jgi:hypothetical protein